MEVTSYFIGFLEISIAITSCFLSIRHLCRNGHLTNWPIFGMLPIHLYNLHRIHDFCTEVLAKSGGTYVFKGPWFTNMSSVCTCDPANVQYIMTTKFTNFSKGPELKESTDILGDGIFNTDADLWKTQRRMAHSLINHLRFRRFMEKTCFEKVRNGLVAVLENVVDKGQVVDLQDVFQRFTFDSTCILLLGLDPGCLSVEFPNVPFAKALDDAEEVILYRHALPKPCWKLLRWLSIWKENSMSKAWEILDQHIFKCISEKREKLSKRAETDEEGIDLLTSYMEDDTLVGPGAERFLRDTVLNLMLAGRDTVSSSLTWFFWLVSTNPLVEIKIIQELSFLKASTKHTIFDIEEVNKLVYLHGALCESLRLFPSIPFQMKSPVYEDVLPSGHKVAPNSNIFLSSYAMGRMESIWGEDCLDFKPERWITKHGGIKYEPSYKFMAFNSGPRTCLGKEVAFTQLKLTAANLIYNYHVEVVKGHPVCPKASIVLQMKHGLMAKITRRTARKD